MSVVSARDPESISPERIRSALDDLLPLVDAQLPRRFASRESYSSKVMTALIVRATGIARSVGVLASPENEPDGQILVRALYEHVVLFAWLGIDRKKRVAQWQTHTLLSRLALHEDAMKSVGIAVLDPSELTQAHAARAAKAPRLPKIDRMATDADDHWIPRVPGLHSPTEGAHHLLSLRGLYVGLYRATSRSAHGSMEAMDACASLDERNRLTIHHQRIEPITFSALSVPLLAIGLVICHEVLGWPDAERVREINDGFVTED